MNDTLFALSTPPGRSGIAVIRATGPLCGPVCASLAGVLPPPRFAKLAHLRCEGESLDHALVLWFPAPASFTGEDMFELHLHGGRAVIDGVSKALLAQGLYPAGPGDFTKRAFQNGKLDLTQAEALADLIDAETSFQRRQALRQEGGALSRRVEAWRGRLVSALARQEALIDFSEEELPERLLEAISQDIVDLIGDITPYLEDRRCGERLREGLVVAILGAPNTGKSSLMNALAGRDVAIVSEHAGTTRDVLEVHLDLGGYPVTILDTAGLREASEGIEAEGISRALARAETSDLKLVLFDAQIWPQRDPASQTLLDERSIAVVSRADLAPDSPVDSILRLSVRTGQGLSELLTAIEQRLEAMMGSGEAGLITRARHRLALQETVDALTRFARAETFDLAAEELRIAARALGRIAGKVGVEELLDQIFSEFCIGK
ncbi:MAG: tRNA uridine-5-carboxymethylaminomethyl(34) synthesis GTPase MnmE [Alphaproteobacteria bacterium]|nr:tRNA uridine-5-carboxymethylaminomethyl(34) synthesis GTPase MnmE [Alphaproteobacteria bacterium]